ASLRPRSILVRGVASQTCYPVKRSRVMKRRWLIGLVSLAAVGTLVLSGYMAQAEHGGFWKSRVSAHFDEALEAAKATPEQKNAVYAARDHLFAAWADERKTHHGELESALTLFSAERLDPQALASHRAMHEADAKQMGDALVQAFHD